MARVESEPTLVARISIRPVPLMAPPVTVVVGTSLGNRQAFTGDQGFVDSQSVSGNDFRPSTGMRSPGLTITMLPVHDFTDR